MVIKMYERSLDASTVWEVQVLKSLSDVEEANEFAVVGYNAFRSGSVFHITFEHRDLYNGT